MHTYDQAQGSARSCLRVLTTVICFVAAATAAGAADPADWAPAETGIFVGIGNYKEFDAQFQKTAIYQMSQDEQAEKLLEVWIKAFDDALSNYAKKLGVDNAEQLKIKPHGAAALIVHFEMPPADAVAKPPEHVAVVADFGENSGKLKSVLDRVSTVTVERGGQKATEEFQGVRITTLHPVEPPEPAETPEEAPEPPMPPGMGMDPEQMIVDELKDIPLPEAVTFATAGNTTVFGSDVKIVQEVLRRVKSQSDNSLSKNEDYMALKRHCAPVGQISAFINFPRIMELAAANNPQTRKEQQATGVNALRALVLTASLAPKDGVDMEMRGFLPVVGERVGVAKMLTNDVVNKSITADATFPAGTVACGWLNFRFETLLDEIYEIQKREDPEQAEFFKANLKVPMGPEGQVLDLEELFKNFTLPLKGHLGMLPPYERDNISILLTLGHRERETTAKLFNLIGPYLQKRELMGQSIYDVAMMQMGVSLALTDPALAIGTTPGIEQLIRSGGAATGENLSADPQFRRTIRDAPKEAWMVYYQDNMKSFEAMLAIHKAAKAAGEEGEEVPAFSFDVTDMILTGLKEHPVVQMDNPEVLRKYMLSALFTLSSDAKGIRLYGTAVRPGTGG